MFNDVLKVILKNTNFILNDHFLGSSVDPIVTLNYAALVMRYVEIQFYKRCKQSFALNAGKHIEENWHRFLHDCCIALLLLDRSN